MALSKQPYKGMRDFYPEDKRKQKYMFAMLRAVAEWFGYEEYDAPVLEPTELYASKTSDEIVNDQTYTFTDRGGRSVTMRTEMTPSVSRMVAARRQELAYPIRWFSIPNLWRYERTQRGRLREFWQPNFDLFGVEGIAGELEIIQIADMIMQSFGASRDMYTIKVNSRKLLEKRIKAAGVKTSIREVIQLVDQFEKLDKAAFKAKLADQVNKPAELYEFFKADGPTEDLKQIITEAQKMGIENIVFTPTLARGFDYYTDFVFEIFDTNPNNNRSMFGGGRYDGLVGAFGVEPVPTIGFAMGDVTLSNFLEDNKLFPDLPPETDVWVLLAGDVYLEAQPVIEKLRYQRLRVAVDSTGRKLPAQLKSAAKRAVRYVVILGDKELQEQKFVLKDMQTGTQIVETLEKIVEVIKSAPLA